MEWLSWHLWVHKNMWSWWVGTCGYVPTYLAHVQCSTCGPTLRFGCSLKLTHSLTLIKGRRRRRSTALHYVIGLLDETPREYKRTIARDEHDVVVVFAFALCFMSMRDIVGFALLWCSNILCLIEIDVFAVLNFAWGSGIIELIFGCFSCWFIKLLWWRTNWCWFRML